MVEKNSDGMVEKTASDEGQYWINENQDPLM